jgi:hypothetical protein
MWWRREVERMLMQMVPFMRALWKSHAATFRALAMEKTKRQSMVNLL